MGRARGRPADRGRDRQERFGRLDLLVNNAGITQDGLLIRMKDEDWDEVLGVNLRGRVPGDPGGRASSMIRQRAGRIVNVTSAAGAMGNAGPGELLGGEGRADRAHEVRGARAGPLGYSGQRRGAGADRDGHDRGPARRAPARRYSRQVPLKRIGTAREVAEVVRFLASEGAGYITGQVIHVNGGLYM